MAELAALHRERKIVHRKCRDACRDDAQSAAWQLPHQGTLRDVLLTRYDQLAALDLAIASYDPQQALFLDLTPQPRRCRAG